MKSVFYTLLLVAFPFLCFAQPVYTSNDYGGVGTALTFSGAAIDSVFINNELSVEGENVNWDFGQLAIVDQFTVAVESKDQSGYQAGFITTCIAQGGGFQECNRIWNEDVQYAIPVNANLNGFTDGGGLEDLKLFRNLEDNLLTEAIIGITVMDFPLAFAYEQYDTILQFPLEYQSQFSGPSAYDLDFSSFGAPFAYFHNQNRASKVDSYGKLMTPYGSFDDCLRLKTKIDYLDTIFANGQNIPIPRTEYVYEWFHSDFEAPLLEIRGQETPLPGPLRITSIQFIDTLRCLQPIPLFTVDTTSKVLVNGEAEFSFFNRSRLGSDYRWDFGDGTTSMEQSPVHIYTQEGTYQVFLTVCNTICDPLLCDQFMIEVEVTSGSTNSIELEPSVFEVRYDASSDLIRIQLDRAEGDLLLFDATGRLLIQREIQEIEFVQDTYLMPSGVYFVIWRNEQGYMRSEMFLK
jgi:hypothetical protein